MRTLRLLIPLLLAVLVWPAALRAVGVVQSNSQQKCINAVNKDVAKVARAQAQNAGRCIKSAGRGVLGGQTAQECVETDNDGKIARATAKTLADEAKLCSPAPDFGYTGATPSNQDAIDEDVALLADVFGAPLESAIVTAAGAKCQEKVAKAYGKIQQAVFKEFARCKKAGLKAGTVDSAATLAGCMNAVTNDVRQKAAKARGKLLKTVASRSCFAAGTAFDFAQMFAGNCSSETGNPGDLATCIAVQVDCRACRLIDLVDGIDHDCDEFDDGDTNASCPPVVPTCDDGRLNQDEADVDCSGASCPGCPDGSPCSAGSDCDSLVCTSGVCEPPTCSDGVTNGDETATDCGGPCPACPDGSGCAQASDCQSGVCTANLCQAPTCSDGVANGDETDLDCGGSCPGCPDGDSCTLTSDCQSLVCSGGVCLAPACSDGVANGDETDVDCGGSCPACADGEVCALASDCTSGVCTASVCQAPTCSDGAANGDETDVDCGGSCPACADGGACALDADCQSQVCTGGVCQAPVCTDGVANGSESDVDCGGSCPACADGGACNAGVDCQSGVCGGGTCQAPTCSDGAANGAETDVDCGGPCAACPDGSGCGVAGDCQSQVCTAGVCQAPTCSDGVANGNESDLDCGGSCPGCPDGGTCGTGADCQNDVCGGGTCQAPTCSDGVANGAETDVDCGGATCPKCALGLGCNAASDCASDLCQGGSCSCGSQAFTFGINSNNGGVFDSAEWPGGTASQNGRPGCSVTINRPSGNIDTVGTLGDDFEVTGFAGYSTCFGTGGEDGDGCQADSCPPAGIPFCQDRRPSCSAALNGSGSARFFVQCNP